MPSADPHTTVADRARSQLDVIASTLRVAPERTDLIRATLEEVAEPCGLRQRLDRPPRWATATDDCTPLEWSVGFRPEGCDIRLLLEAEDDPPSVAAYWDASKRFTRFLTESYGLGDQLWREVEPSFVANDPNAFAAAYHGIEFSAEGGRAAKVYVNPGMVGEQWPSVRAAFEPLGLGPALDRLTAELGEIDLPLVAIYLGRPEAARVKLYLRSRTVDPLLVAADLCDPPVARECGSFIDDVFGDDVPQRPKTLAVHYRVADPDRPPRGVLAMPVVGPSDSASPFTQRFARVLDANGLDADGYLDLVRGLEAALPDGVPAHIGPFGLQSWVSYQRLPDATVRITVYFRSMSFAPRYGWLSAIGDRTWPCAVPDEAGADGVG